ncbi:MAG: pyridoxamine 5'-phosphate oxidase family protein [Lachnospiraceae bacterium]|nr:pyridoxamine 5'-phosphate oxidase family protein [Lachnospiraceae bacterium]
MRRQEKEVKDLNEIEKILENCKILNLAIHDGEYPYAITVNGVAVRNGDTFDVYFHGANEGKKVDLLKKNNKVSFITYGMTRVVQGEKICGDTREFASVWGIGDVEFLQSDEDKAFGMRSMLSHLGDSRQMPFDPARFARINVYKIHVKELTCKRSSVATSIEGLQKAGKDAYTGK